MKVAVFSALLSVFFASALSAEQVFFFQAEDYDKNKSNPGGVWVTKKDDPSANKNGVFGEYVIPMAGGDGKSGLIYNIPTVKPGEGGDKIWNIWGRGLFRDGGTDSVWNQISNDLGKTWFPANPNGPPDLRLGEGAWNSPNWKWQGPGRLEAKLKVGDTNLLRISEREAQSALDVLCLRNDGKPPTDEEFKAYKPPKPESVQQKGNLATTWGSIKANPK